MNTVVSHLLFDYMFIHILFLYRLCLLRISLSCSNIMISSVFISVFFVSSRRRHTSCALVTGVQTVCSSDLLVDRQRRAEPVDDQAAYRRDEARADPVLVRHRGIAAPLDDLKVVHAARQDTEQAELAGAEQERAPGEGAVASVVAAHVRPFPPRHAAGPRTAGSGADRGIPRGDTVPGKAAVRAASGRDRKSTRLNTRHQCGN